MPARSIGTGTLSFGMVSMIANSEAAISIPADLARLAAALVLD